MGTLANSMRQVAEKRLSWAERKKIPRKKFVFPERLAWPIHDKKHALIAISYMQRGKGYADDYPMIAKLIAKLYPDLKKEAMAAAKAGAKIAPRRPAKKKKLAAWREHFAYGDVLTEQLPALFKRASNGWTKSPDRDSLKAINKLSPPVSKMVSAMTKLEMLLTQMRSLLRQAPSSSMAYARILQIMMRVIVPAITFCRAFFNEAFHASQRRDLGMEAELRQMLLVVDKLDKLVNNFLDARTGGEPIGKLP